jgi:arylsulfatase A-like enzyme
VSGNRFSERIKLLGKQSLAQMSDTFLLITVDSLRADRVGVTTPSHRTERNLTPNLDQFGTSGTVCTNAFATGPGTRLSFPGILTSTTPLAYGGYNRLSEDRPSLADQFQEAGFTTGAVHSNAQLSPEFGYDRGFNAFDDRLGRSTGNTVDDIETSSGDSGNSIRDRFRDIIGDQLFEYPRLYRYIKDIDTLLNGFSRPYATATETRKAATSWLANQDGPTFLWVHFMDPHVPYFPPERFQEELNNEPISEIRIADLWYKLNGRPKTITHAERESLEQLYDATVRYFDHEFGRLLDDLEEMGIDDAVIAFTSDHGDEFRDHGGLTHSPQLYNELVHVPLLFNGLLDQNMLSEPISLLDIAPTLTEAIDGNYEEYWGRNLRTNPPTDERLVFSEVSHAPEAPRQNISFENRIIACRNGRFTYIDDHLHEREELYDRDRDPDEQELCGDEFPDIRKDLAAAVANHWERVIETSPDLHERTMSDDVESRLRDLGYM